jgi:capsular polysaccharide biosynthesis protein
MELNDALHRLVGQHWRLLAACLLLGLILGLLFAPHGAQYSASARLVLDTPDPVARQQSEAIADTAKAIATSPSQVSRALKRAGVQRGDPADFAKQHVSVKALGTSGVLELSVSDRDSRVAASVANALASLLIRTRLDVTNGQTNQIFADLDRRTADLSRKISKADDYVNSLTLRIATAPTPSAAISLPAQRDAAERARDFLVQQRSVLESERVSLISNSALRPRPSIISPASPPTKVEPSHRMVYLVLGALLGLILGMAAAGLVETVRPTVVGNDALAGEFGAALLGTVMPDAAAATANDIGARVRLAAEAAGVRNVALFAAGPGVDLDRLADSLRSSAAAGAVETNGNRSRSRNGHGRALRIGRFTPESPPLNNGTRSGLILVSPTAVKKTELSDVVHLLKVSALPLLGLITYAEPESRLRRGVKSKINLLHGMVAR